MYTPQQGATEASLPLALRVLGTKPRRVLNGGNEFEYYGEEARAGDVLTRISKVVDLQERAASLGKMLIMTTESSFYNQEGKLVATQRGTSLIY